jgi:hypothetical protein
MRESIVSCQPSFCVVGIFRQISHLGEAHQLAVARFLFPPPCFGPGPSPSWAAHLICVSQVVLNAFMVVSGAMRPVTFWQMLIFLQTISTERKGAPSLKPKQRQAVDGFQARCDGLLRGDDQWILLLAFRWHRLDLQT